MVRLILEASKSSDNREADVYSTAIYNSMKTENGLMFASGCLSW